MLNNGIRFVKNIVDSFQNKIVDIKQSSTLKNSQIQQNTTQHFYSLCEKSKGCILIIVNRKYCRNLHNFRIVNDII